MARPEKNTVDYFPFICAEGKKMYYLEETYGNDGFATFVKLLRELANTEFHYLNLSKKTTKMFLAAKCKVSIDVLEKIISDLVDLEKFDEQLWRDFKVIWCQDFINSIQDAYTKRRNKCIDKKGLLHLLLSLHPLKPSKSNSEGVSNTQTILKEINEKKRKMDNILLSEIKTSDLENEVVEYFEIAKAFQGLFIKNLEEKESPTKHQRNANFKNYVNPIRLMMTDDGVSKEHLTMVFKFLDSPEGVFWKPNILSTSKLRKNIQQLIIKSQSPNGNGNKSNIEGNKASVQGTFNEIDSMYGEQ